MIWLTGAYHAVALVVLAAGAAKLAAPGAFAQMLHTIGSLPGLGTMAGLSDLAARRVALLVGAMELALGSVAIVYGGRVVAGLIAALYTLFALAVLAARRAGAHSCGCFGSLSAPPGRRHVAIDLAAAAIAAGAAALDAASPLQEVLAGRGVAGAGYAAVVVLAAIGVIALSSSGRRA